MGNPYPNGRGAFRKKIKEEARKGLFGSWPSWEAAEDISEGDFLTLEQLRRVTSPRAFVNEYQQQPMPIEAEPPMRRTWSGRMSSPRPEMQRSPPGRDLRRLAKRSDFRIMGIDYAQLEMRAITQAALYAAQDAAATLSMCSVHDEMIIELEPSKMEKNLLRAWQAAFPEVAAFRKALFGTVPPRGYGLPSKLKRGNWQKNLERETRKAMSLLALLDGKEFECPETTTSETTSTPETNWLPSVSTVVSPKQAKKTWPTRRAHAQTRPRR